MINVRLSVIRVFKATTMIIFGTYLPIYLTDIGFSGTEVGVLSSVGQAFVILAQFIWGPIIDRAPTKNRMLFIFFSGSAIAMLGIMKLSGLTGIMIMYCIYCFFNAPSTATIDTISLDAISNRGGQLSQLKIVDTLSIGLISWLVGIIISNANQFNPTTKVIFPISVTSFILTIGSIALLPSVRGYQRGKKIMPFYKLFKDIDLLIYLLYVCAIQLSTGMSKIYLNIYIKNQIGADFVGMVMMVASLSVIPYLLFAKKIDKKISEPHLLILSGLINSIQFLLLSFTSIPIVILITQGLEAISRSVFGYILIIYIDKNVPKELKATGQMMVIIAIAGLPFTIGNSLGGILNDWIGTIQLLQVCGYYTLVVSITFGLIVALKNRKKLISI